MAGQSYSIIGTGALGGYYGARLAHAGRTVRFLVNRDYEHVRRHGLRVDSIHGDFSLAEPEVYALPEGMPASDVVVVGLKTTRNSLLPTLLPPATSRDALVLSMQNGLGIEADVAKAVPGRTIIGGLAFLCSNKVGAGHVKHLDYGDVRLAEYRADGQPAGITPAVRAVAEDFRAAGVGVALEADLDTARWKKLVWNVPYNGLCVVRNVTTDVVMADPKTRERVEHIMLEVLAIAAARGHPIPTDFVRTMLDFTAKMAPYDPSMKLDYEGGRPLEIEALYARPLRAARDAGVSCPLTLELYEQLLQLDPAVRGSV
ncbi:MAG: putative 2-dehydropantoate 2-reductase [Candidatus Binatia bacterium]|nr:putative 2-dehydropantoate 2-reductase [Candidatus Binatia bacterium]